MNLRKVAVRSIIVVLLLIVVWGAGFAWVCSRLPTEYLVNPAFGRSDWTVSRSILQFYLLDTPWGQDKLRDSSNDIIAYVSSASSVDDNVLHASSQRRAIVWIRELLKLGKPVNAKMEGFSALEDAVMSNQIILARYLIRHGARVQSFSYGEHHVKHYAPLIALALCMQRVDPEANAIPMLRLLKQAYRQQNIPIHLKVAEKFAQRCRPRSNPQPIYMDR